MARGAFRGALTAWLGLITLQTVVSKSGSSQVSGIFGVLDSMVQRALDPNIAALPDHGKPDANTVASAAQAAVAAAQNATAPNSGTVAAAAAAAAASAARFAPH